MCGGRPERVAGEGSASLADLIVLDPDFEAVLPRGEGEDTRPLARPVREREPAVRGWEALNHPCDPAPRTRAPCTRAAHACRSTRQRAARA